MALLTLTLRSPNVVGAHGRGRRRCPLGPGDRVEQWSVGGGEKVQCRSWTWRLHSRPIGPKSSTRIVAGNRSATDPDGQFGCGHHLAPAPRQG